MDSGRKSEADREKVERAKILKNSQTIKEQVQVIKTMQKFRADSYQLEKSQIKKSKHAAYMLQNLVSMGKSIIHFDYGQPWIYYYILNTISLLGEPFPNFSKQNIIKGLEFCWNTDKGGFGGGYKQLPHLAPTYAGFLTCLLIGPEAYHILDKDGMTKFFKSCKKGGQYQIAEGAELDLRGCYIVAIIVKMMKLDESLLEGVAETIIESQTYEGGLSNIAGGQAHGGYTFCGVAALSILGRLQDLDIPRLMLWLNRRQCAYGGFNGRTNKLLDSCYTFWVGANFNIINNYFNKKVSSNSHLLYNEGELQKYVTFFCQDQRGGLWDKPGKSRDIYHTCYSLSGLGMSQENDFLHQDDLLITNDPIYNIEVSKLEEARKFYWNKINQ